jgi:hypothetical protein
VTAAVQQRVVDGAFDDPTRTAAFTRTFADLYLTAVEDRRVQRGAGRRAGRRW